MIKRSQKLLKEYLSHPVISRLVKSGLQLSENKELAFFISFEDNLAENRMGEPGELFQIDTYANLYPMCFTTQGIAEFHHPRESSYYFYFWDLYGWWYENLRGKEIYTKDLAEESISLRVKDGEYYQHILSAAPLHIRLESKEILDKLYLAGHMYRWDNEGIFPNYFFMKEPYYSAEDVAKCWQYETPLTAGNYEKYCREMLERFTPKRD